MLGFYIFYKHNVHYFIYTLFTYINNCMFQSKRNKIVVLVICTYVILDMTLNHKYI